MKMPKKLTQEEKQYLKESMDLQSKYCRDHGYPNFVPHDGFCWKCGEPIFAPPEMTGWHYDKEYAATNLFTGCRSCGWSYCD